MRAERGDQALQLLAEASRALAGSLDYADTLARVAHLAVPHLATWCVVDVLGEDGAIERLATAHVDPAKVAWAKALERRYPPDPNAVHGVARVLRTGRSELYSEVSDALLAASAVDAEHLALLRQVGMQSALIVPLTARGRTLGTISLVLADTDRRYGPADLALAEELARRAGTALDNARLYRDARAAEAELRALNEALEQRVAERTAQLDARNRELQEQVTERERTEATLRESEARFRDLFDQAPVGYYELDPEGRITRVNQTFLALLGYTEPELLGQPIWEFVHEGEAARRFLFAAVMPSERGLTLERDYRRNDGTLVPVLVEARPLRDRAGRVTGLRATLQEIGERKRIEAERAQLLAQEHAARRQAEAANQELEAFSYSVSHDLRAPLRSIDGFSQALLEDYADQLDAEGRDALTRIRSASQRMGQLIDDLLSLSRVTRRELHREPVNLSALAESIAAELQATAPDRPVDWVIAPALIADGDPHLLRIALENLLGNAWKFTGNQPRARIELGVQEQDGTPVYFVTDNGAGFDMAYADKLFGAFQRLHSLREFPGTGIGLATVARIVHRHGGRVWAEGAVHQGATFYFTLASGGERWTPK